MDTASPTTTISTSDHSRRKRKKKSSSSSSSLSPSRTWKSEKQQQIYSTKLVHALTDLRINKQQPSSSPSNPSGRAVREVADRALAVAARGKTLWSRAILSKAIKLKFRKQKKQSRNPKQKKTATVMRLKGKGLPAVQRKVKVLSRLVPGCRKQTLPVVLEETTDYIAAMEMQIRTMTAILAAVNAQQQPQGNEGGQTHMLG